MNVPQVAGFVLPLRWSYPEWWSLPLCCRDMQAHKTWVVRASWDGPMSPQAWKGSLIGNFQPVKKGEFGKRQEHPSVSWDLFCFLESRPRLGGP